MSASYVLRSDQTFLSLDTNRMSSVYLIILFSWVFINEHYLLERRDKMRCQLLRFEECFPIKVRSYVKPSVTGNQNCKVAQFGSTEVLTSKYSCSLRGCWVMLYRISTEDLEHKEGTWRWIPFDVRLQGNLKHRSCFKRSSEVATLLPLTKILPFGRGASLSKFPSHVSQEVRTTNTIQNMFIFHIHQLRR